MQSHILSCKSVNKSFGGLHALNDINLQFPSSGIVAIIGPNGAGKTTLFNILTGFTRPDVGHCYWDDLDITRLSPHQIVKLGITRTFQGLRIISRISAIDNVLLGFPFQRGESLIGAFFRWHVSEQEATNRNKAMHLLQFVGLEENAADLAGELSYGQQKLLALACCLATESHALLLDEPVAGVHPEMIQHISRLLRELRDTGKLIIFIEHDIGVVRDISDRIIVMDAGKIIAQGPSEVLDRPEIMEAYVG
jgi:ABC-type branched-subunit amino acid transport system ATPase component